MKVGQRTILITGAFLGGLGVAIGAFGAHALKSTLELQGRVETFELAVKYEFYHALAILAIGLLYPKNATTLTWAFLSMLCGVILFSGSLYALSLSGATMLGMITPFGGVLLIIGWILLIRALAKTPY